MMAKRPTLPKSDPKVAALFDRLLPSDKRIVIRPMFDHKAAFASGHMFTGTFGKYIFVRLDESSRVQLLTSRRLNASAALSGVIPRTGTPVRDREAARSNPAEPFATAAGAVPYFVR